MPCYSRGSSDPRSSLRTRIRTAASTLAIVIALSSAPINGFGSVAQRQQQRVETRRYYRHMQDSVTIATDDVSILTNTLLPQAGKMPTWLRRPRGHLTEENMKQLRDAMLASFFTENEALKLVFAIEEAASGDRNKMAGAAEFCLILVETMEMGLNVLIAAAFHYCSCVTVRERSLLLPLGADATLNLWEHQEHSGIRSFGEHPSAIARDAARLKKLEMVAASIMQSAGKSARVSPNARDSENLQRLLLTEAKDWRALAIRSAACLYRLKGIQAAGDDLTPDAVRVSREALYIFAPIASRLGMHRLKNELEDAAFGILYRRQYDAVTSLSRQIRFSKDGLPRRSRLEVGKADIGENMKQVLNGVMEDMKEMLRKDPDFSSLTENVSVTARVKEPYSMWKKMLRNSSQHILQVPDALALRVVLDAKKLTSDEDNEVTRARERALCYYVQKLCTERWRPLASNPRFKDYIDRPKANGYQSLHYTASTTRGGQDWTMEIQIRSGEMHQVAEYGLASHWDYKAQSKKGKSNGPQSDQSSDAYLRSVQEWHWQQRSGTLQWDTNSASETEPLIFSDESQSRLRADRIRARTARLAPYIEALTEAQSDMALEHVYVFLSQSQTAMRTEGKVIALPAGACVLDALRVGEKMLGIQLNWREERSGVSHNGSTANITQKLKNGDILVVP